MEKCAEIFQEQNDIGNLVDDESDLLMDLLKKFDLVIVMKFLKEAHITYRSLQYIKNEDLKEIIPLVGLRLEFREKLFTWRKKEFGIDDETLSVPSKVQDWLYDSQQQSPSSLGSPLDKRSTTARARNGISNYSKYILSSACRQKGFTRSQHKQVSWTYDIPALVWKLRSSMDASSSIT
ncbi:hypothetical protein CVS40_4956 [Lucilia cuprina]|nr:hypothetical protein CVS40_4956 [Lucilia cuprina]